MEVLLIIAALLLSAVFYLVIGFRQGRRMRSLADLIPMRRGHAASVENAAEFSASTVATTISLATVIMAYFELAPRLGGWLLWTVATTAAGLFGVRLAVGRIWKKLELYGERIPTLHEFLGTEYQQPSLAVIGAACTSLGFLGALAVELTVGSSFLASLLPGIPAQRFVFVLALVVLAYTAIGGFRTVIMTDRYQMVGIWLLVAGLAAYYAVSAVTGPGLAAAWKRVPVSTWDFSYREGLWAFLLGIAVINIPTFISDMSIWQRVSSARDPRFTLKGLTRSVLSASLTWGAFVVLACMVPMVVPLSGQRNPLLDLFREVAVSPGLFHRLVLFVSALGLYAAMMSTASTQLIAASHTIHEDLLSRRKGGSETGRESSFQELQKTRAILAGASIASILVAEVLWAFGFTIADLVFAIYGAQLGLFPPVLAGLLFDRDRLRPLGRWAATAVGSGFIGGWSAAFIGKGMGEEILIFLAPAVSLAVSGAILGVGFFLCREATKRPHEDAPAFSAHHPR